MKSLSLIYSNPPSREAWKSFSPAEQADGFRAYSALTQDLQATGHLIATEALADPSLGKRLAVRDGQVLTTDGPYAEAKELLAGFYLIHCDTVEEAIAYAARVPEAPLSLVEVRPVMDLSGFEM